MNEAFARAALYAVCEKSPILKQIQTKNLQVSELRELININSSFQTRYLPILLSKFVIKIALQYGVNTFKKDYPTLCDYIKPENLKVIVESDELACLELSTPNNILKKHNIMFTVMKNIITNVLGLTLDNLEKILNDVGIVETDGSSTEETRNDQPSEKIDIDSNLVKQTINSRQVPIILPKIYSNTFSNASVDERVGDVTTNVTHLSKVVPSLYDNDALLQRSNIKTFDNSKETTSIKRKASDCVNINNVSKIGGKKSKMGSTYSSNNYDPVNIDDINNESDVRVREYVDDTLNYTMNKRDDIDAHNDIDATLPETNINDNESLLSITPSHSASQYDGHDDDDCMSKVNGIDMAKQYERFDNDRTDVDFYVNSDNDASVARTHHDDDILYSNDGDEDEENDNFYNDSKSQSSIELTTGNFKKNANPDNFLKNAEQFLSRVSMSNNDKTLTNIESAEMFDLD